MTGRRLVLLIGLALALVTPFLPQFGLVHLPIADPMLRRETFWWGLCALVLLYVHVVERRPLTSIGLHRPDWKTLASGLGGAVVVVFGVGLLVGYLVPMLHLPRNSEALRHILDTPPWYRALIAVRAGVVEEVLFRGYGIERLAELSGSRVLAAVVTCAIFALGHLSYWGLAQTLFAGLAGVVLTLLYLWRRDLGANMLAHAVTDAVGLLLR